MFLPLRYVLASYTFIFCVWVEESTKAGVLGISSCVWIYLSAFSSLNKEAIEPRLGFGLSFLIVFSDVFANFGRPILWLAWVCFI